VGAVGKVVAGDKVSVLEHGGRYLISDMDTACGSGAPDHARVRDQRQFVGPLRAAQPNSSAVDPKQVAGTFGNGIEDLLDRKPVRDRLFDAVEAVEEALPFSKAVKKSAVLLGALFEIGSGDPFGLECRRHAQRHTKHRADLGDEIYFVLIEGRAVSGHDENSVERVQRLHRNAGIASPVIDETEHGLLGVWTRPLGCDDGATDDNASEIALEERRCVAERSGDIEASFGFAEHGD